MSIPRMDQANQHLEWVVSRWGEVVVYPLDSDGRRRGDSFWVHHGAEDLVALILGNYGSNHTIVSRITYDSSPSAIFSKVSKIKTWEEFVEKSKSYGPSTRNKLIGACFALWAIDYPIPVDFESVNQKFVLSVRTETQLLISDLSLPEMFSDGARFEWIVNAQQEIVVYQLNSEGKRSEHEFWTAKNAETMLALVLKKYGEEHTAVHLRKGAFLGYDLDLPSWEEFVAKSNNCGPSTRDKLIGAYEALRRIDYPMPVRRRRINGKWTFLLEI